MAPRARTRSRLHAIAGATVAALLLAGGWTVWRHRAPQPRSISLSWVDVIWDKPARRRNRRTSGPAWPPTDDDWLFAFDRARVGLPAAGPVAPRAGRRRSPVRDRSAPASDAVCRTPGTCGVALGGQLWGEHVYAALDGVVDRAAPGGADEHGGGYVRIAHLGGMVFTHYFHLAAIPRGVVRGARVSAGEVIGLVGDTGTGSEKPGPHPHLHFALSIRPSAEWPETFWIRRR